MKILASRYRLEKEIGAGGEARVFQARDLELDRDVAVRLSSLPISADRPEVPSNPHPGWVRLLDAGLDPEKKPYQVFELLSGPTLRARVEKAPLEPGAWRDFVGQSLDAVEALHAAAWVHGDLNADNFLRTPESGWKLLELPFHRFDAAENRSAVFGSIHTLAPEQIDRAPASRLTDLYALGCLYYYAACGAYPHAGGSAPQIAIERLRFFPEPLAPKAPGLSRAETGFVMKLLARQPGDRPADIAAARRLLSHHF